MPFPPGGGTDLHARTVQPKLTEALRQQINAIDNPQLQRDAVAAYFDALAAQMDRLPEQAPALAQHHEDTEEQDA